MREILRSLMDANGDDAYTLQDKSGVPQPTTHRFLSGLHKSANEATVKRWADAYGISSSQLRGDVPIDFLFKKDDEVIGVELKTYKTESDNNDIINIPLLNIKASMGGGHENEVENIVDVFPINRLWAHKYIYPYTNDNNLALINAIGDSMSPTFNDGDMLIVDTGDKSIKDGNIYVIEIHNRLFIKRMRQRIDGTFEISSDNLLIKTVDILNGEHEVAVKGRVIWVWNGKKL